MCLRYFSVFHCHVCWPGGCSSRLPRPGKAFCDSWLQMAMAWIRCNPWKKQGWETWCRGDTGTGLVQGKACTKLLDPASFHLRFLMFLDPCVFFLRIPADLPGFRSLVFFFNICPAWDHISATHFSQGIFGRGETSHFNRVSRSW